MSDATTLFPAARAPSAPNKPLGEGSAPIPPMMFRWTGDAMTPQHPRLADKHFVIGETYALSVYEHRSDASHRHYFALINEAWANLPEHLAERFPNPEHLRKYALIKAGYCDERSIPCSSKAEAQRLAAFIRPMDDYAIVVASQGVVTAYTAKSQSMRAMGKAVFQRSKDDVLRVLSEMIGVDPASLRANAGASA